MRGTTATSWTGWPPTSQSGDGRRGTSSTGASASGPAAAGRRRSTTCPRRSTTSPSSTHRSTWSGVAAVGHSAGGHLALWAAGRKGARVPLTAVVGQAAVSDLEQAAAQGVCGGMVEQLLGGPPDRVPDRYREASPARRLPLEVPTLLVHGGRDDIVPAAMSREFAAAAGMRAGGARGTTATSSTSSRARAHGLRWSHGSNGCDHAGGRRRPRRGRSARGVPRPVRARRRPPDLCRRQLARGAGTRRPGGARGPHRRVGRPARHGLARLGRRTGDGRRPARRGRPRRRPGAGDRVGLDDGQPLQARRRRARRATGRDRLSTRPTSPPTGTCSRG